MVGSGSRFLSGISYYTLLLSNAFAERVPTSSVLMRQLLPTALYPGKDRVGKQLTRTRFSDRVSVYDGVDWHWGGSLPGALAFLRRNRPDFVVFQWWTGTVLHSYLALAMATRLLGGRSVLEFHETLDTGEAAMRWVRGYVSAGLPLLVKLSSAAVVHSEQDRKIIAARHSWGNRPIRTIELGPFGQYCLEGVEPSRPCPIGVTNILYFGVIRPYKGLEDLVEAFNSMSEAEVSNYWLTIVGESWEGWTVPLRLIENSPHRHRITFVNRYVEDEEVARFFAGADVVALPYRRSSASGPLHVAMSHGLPAIVSRVGGLTEIVDRYEGGVPIPPGDPAALRDALGLVRSWPTRRFHYGDTWDDVVSRYLSLFHVVARRQ